MSDECRAYVWTHSPYRGNDRLLHVILADLANDTHDYLLWASPATLAEKAAMTAPTVRRIMARMATDGYLQLVTVGGGRGRHAEYRFLMPPETVRGDAQFTGGETVRGSTETVREMNGLEAETVREPETVHIQTEVDLLTEVNRTCSFDDFYARYPRKAERPTAERAWKRATKRAKPEAIMAGLASHVADWKRNRPSHRIPYPATWLNADSWNDQPTRAGPDPPARARIETDREKRSGRLKI